MRERAVLDTLVEAGVARSRSEALAWCVRLVGDNESAWIEKLRGVLGAVKEARGEGPRPAARTSRHNQPPSSPPAGPSRPRRPIMAWWGRGAPARHARNRRLGP